MALVFRYMDEQYKGFYAHANAGARGNPLRQVPDELWEAYIKAGENLGAAEEALKKYFREPS